MSQLSRDKLSLKGLALSETEQLQKDIDDFTKLLEKEKRQEMIIDDQLKQVISEIKEREAAIDKIKKPRENKPVLDKRDHIAIKSNTNRIKNETLKLNATKTTNKKLRDQIDVLRKELMSKKEECKRFSKLTEKAKTLAEEQNHEALSNLKIADEHIAQRIALRSKHEEDKELFETQIKEMQSKLAKRDETAAVDEQRNDQIKDQTQTDAHDYKNPIQILKLRLAKIVATNKEKKRLMDQYLRNVKVIEDAFDQIKEATGIQSNDEIVTSFIKAEE